MGRLKAKGLVKRMRGGAALVRGQLDQSATAPAALFDRPFEHRPADTGGTFADSDAYPLDLTAPHALPRQSGNEAELQHADHLLFAFGDRKKLVGIALDCRERVAVICVRCRREVLAEAADRVIGEQADDW